MFRIWQNGGRFEVDSTPRAIIQARENGQISQSDPKERWRRLIGLRMRMLESMLHSGISQEDKQDLLQAVFDYIRILFPLNRREAESLYESLESMGFKPRQSATCSLKYIILTKLIGVVEQKGYYNAYPGNQLKQTP